MQNDQEYYLSRRRSWPLSVRFSYEFSGPVSHLKKFRSAYAIGFIAFILLVSGGTFIKHEASIDELLLIVLASTIHLLRGLAVISLLFAWLSAEFIHNSIYELMSNAWTEREKMRRPGVSFQIPHWRFYIPAVLIRTLIFVSWLAVMFFLLYVVPAWSPELGRFIPDNFPI